MGNALTPDEFAAIIDNSKATSPESDLLEMLIYPDDLPKEASNTFFGFITPEMILSKNDKKMRMKLENRFCILRNLKVMSQPYYQTDLNNIMFLENCRSRFCVEMLRSDGGFERISQLTQIREMRTNKLDAEPKQGFVTGVKRKLGLAPKADDGAL